MKNLIVFIVAILTFNSCNAQSEKKENKNAKEQIEPKVDYKVNKKYDEFGNLIEFDSTYTYYYSNIDKNALINDSIFKKFNEHFNKKDPFIGNSFFNDFFKQDDYLNDDFFSEDFYRGNFSRQKEMMNRILSRMDSLKNDFLIRKHPIIPIEKDSLRNN